MRTINFTEQDIKDCKLALANQNLTSLQSAFLGQYINNLEGQLQQKENIIKEVREYLESYNLEYLHETKENNLAYILEELLEILKSGDNK